MCRGVPWVATTQPVWNGGTDPHTVNLQGILTYRNGKAGIAAIITGLATLALSLLLLHSSSGALIGLVGSGTIATVVGLGLLFHTRHKADQANTRIYLAIRDQHY